jgi:hypothetical protein
VSLRFALYQDQAGGLPLWSETQAVKVGSDGRYSVLLSATSAEGLPQALFKAGEARWISARLLDDQIGGFNQDADAETANPYPPARSLLAAVPYAFKSVDAETLAGRPATEYVTREDLESAIASGVQTAAQPNAEAASATVISTGTSGYVPVWTGARSLGNSVIAVSGTSVGIGTATPATLLDVNGKSTLRAAVSLLASAATMAAGVNSPALQLGASTYSNAGHAPVAQNFAWQAVSAGNNSTSPSFNLTLLFGTGTEAPKATGLSIAPDGRITFAPRQKFPLGSANSSPITGVTAGTGLN